MLLGAVLLAATSGCHRRGGRTDPQPVPPPDSATLARLDSIARAHAPVRPPITLPIGDGVVRVEARAYGRVAVVASEPQQMALEFAPASVSEFVAESSRLLARRRPRRERSNVRRALLDEVGGDGGALSFSRRVTGQRVIYRFFFADNAGGGFPITVGPAHARALLQAMRDAATALTPKPAPAKRRRTRAKAGARTSPRATPPRTAQPDSAGSRVPTPPTEGSPP